MSTNFTDIFINETIINDANSAWDIGTLNHTSLWSVYTFFNLFGSSLCLLLIYGIYLLKNEKTSIDVLIGGLCSGCIWMSIPCATQCILNMIVDRFAYGTVACNIESIFHFIGILVQFLSIMCIGWRNYLAVVHEYVINYKVSEYLILIVWVVAITGTIVSGTFSEIYLMPSGTYCFYAFTSPAFLYWFVPVMLGALFSLTFCYVAIYRYTRQLEEVGQFTSSTSVASPSLPTSREARESVVIRMEKEINIEQSNNNNNNNNLGQKMNIIITGINTNNIGAPKNIPGSPPNTPVRRQLSLSSFPPCRIVDVKINKYVTDNSPIHTRDSSRNLSIKDLPENRQNERIQRQHRREKTKMSINVAKQSSIYIFLFFFGWISAVVCSFFELFSHKHVPQGADVTLTMFAILHTMAVPIVYGLSSERVRSSLMRRHKCFTFFGSCLNFFKIFDCCRCCKRILKNSRNSNGTIGTTNYTVKQIRANPLV